MSVVGCLCELSGLLIRRIDPIISLSAVNWSPNICISSTDKVMLEYVRALKVSHSPLDRFKNGKLGERKSSEATPKIEQTLLWRIIYTPPPRE